MTGQLWIAQVSPQSANAEVVAVIGHPPRDRDHVIVAPTSTQLHQAGEHDLVVDNSPLGYSHLVSLANQGTLKRSQLTEYLGRLDGAVRADMVALYRWLTGASGRLLLTTRTGPPILSSEDPRLVFRSYEGERLRELWELTNKELGAGYEGATAGDVLTLGQLVALEVEGEAWDRSTLLEHAHVEGKYLDAVLADRLDLTQAQDVPAVARIVVALDIPNPQRLVRRTLELSPGGLLVGGGTGERMAARSWHDVGAEQRSRDIYRGQFEVDESPEGRKQAIAAYLREFDNELDAIR